MPWTRPCILNVVVWNGVAELAGVVESAAESSGARVAAESTPSVRAADDNVVAPRVAAASE